MSHHPENSPEWYWINGLHDAGIVGVESFEFPFDYNKFVGEKSKYNRNLLVLKINAKGALYDTSVEEIHFYNYKILTTDVSLENRKTSYRRKAMLHLTKQANCDIFIPSVICLL